MILYLTVQDLMLLGNGAFTALSLHVNITHLYNDKFVFKDVFYI